MQNLSKTGVVLILVFSLVGCASLSNAVSAPNVQLKNVQAVGLGFKGQTFLLSFDVENPNAFPLPIREINYDVKLDGHRFASGETVGEFTVPGNGNSTFAISVELNLLQTSPQLLFIVRDAAISDIQYEVEGRLGIDMPLVPSLKYSNNGTIRLSADAF